MDIIIGIILVMITISLFSRLKNRNNSLNDYYPFTDKGDLK